MHCEYCGNYVENDETKCPSCGAQLDHQPPEDTPPPDVSKPDMSDSYSWSQEDMPRVKSYMVWSIICTIFFLSPFGLVAFIYGILVKIRVRSGDADGAIKASKRAKIWMVIGFIAGIMMYYIGSKVA